MSSLLSSKHASKKSGSGGPDSDSSKSSSKSSSSKSSSGSKSGDRSSTSRKSTHRQSSTRSVRVSSTEDIYGPLFLKNRWVVGERARKVTVFGAGSFGTAMAVMAARAGRSSNEPAYVCAKRDQHNFLICFSTMCTNYPLPILLTS
jgi:hypothetical protein